MELLTEKGWYLSFWTLNFCPVGRWLLWSGFQKLLLIPPQLMELCSEGNWSAPPVSELKAVGIMKAATFAHLSLFRDECTRGCDGQQDTIHC